MAKLLHLSDIHLNYGYGQLEEGLQKYVKSSLYQSFLNSINFAIENDIEIVLVAGDLLDSPFIGKVLHSQMIKAIKELINNKIHFVYCSGNHDLNNYKLFTDELLESKWITIFDKASIEKKEIRTKNDELIRIVGCGHENDFVDQMPINLSMKKNIDDPMTIGLFHTSVVGSKEALLKDPYMPVEKDLLERLQYDYIALGHIHKREELTERVIYSGSIMGLTKKEVGQKGGYIVQLTDKLIDTEFVPFNVIQWESIEIDITDMPSNLKGYENALKEAIDIHLEKLISKDKLKDLILNIHLKGTTDNFEEINSSACQEYLKLSLEQHFGMLNVNFKDVGLKKYNFTTLKISEEGYLNEVKTFIESMEKNKMFLESLSERKGLDEINNIEEYLKDNKDFFYQKVMNLLTK